MSTADPETLAVYAARAQDYAARVTKPTPSDTLSAFIAALPPRSAVLDLGCGPGNAAAAMMAAGHQVTAIDASPEMVKIAQQRYGVPARVRRFDQIRAQAKYDGVWANFSLLHAPRAALPGYLQQISTALRPGGMFHIGMKIGDGARRDALGRFYTYVQPDELLDLLREAGLTPAEPRFGVDGGLSGEEAPYMTVTSYA